MLRTMTLLAAVSAATIAFAQQKPPAGSPPPPAQAQQPAQQQGQPPGPPPKPTPQQTAEDVKALHACIALKSPEGELPPEGPQREKIIKEAEGGPQACVGAVIEACQKAGGAEEACTLREATAWLAATALDKEDEKRFGAKNAGVYKAAQSKILPNAVALCKAAASVSAWGADAIKANSKDLVFDLTQPCVMDAVVQQSLIILVNKRGN